MNDKKEKLAIGIFELSAIHKGFEVQDQVLKSSLTEKILARTICSGKYAIIVRGEVADVETASRIASGTGGYAIINNIVIPNLHPAVFPALAGSTVLESPAVEGLLVLETFSVAAAIKAADIAVKSAEVTLLRIHVAMAVGGKGLAVLTGDVEALRSASEAAVEFLAEDGSLTGHSLISRPHPDVLRELI